MPTLYPDHTSLLHLAERNGCVRSLTKKTRVIFEKDEILPTDHQALLSAMEAAGLPVAFSSLAGVGLGSLVLTERGTEVVDGDPRVFDVTLKYDHVLDGPNQVLYNRDPEAAQPILYVKAKTSIAQKTTNFFRPFGDPDAERELITTAHTFLNTDQDVAGTQFVPGHPNTVYQGGEVTVPFPQTNFRLVGIWDLNEDQSPWDIHYLFIARINDDAWLGRPAFSWLCSEVQSQMLNASARRYEFEFEFQFDLDTWNPTVIFNDQRTGRPPADVLVASEDDANGVRRLAFNRLVVGPPGVTQPAGYWTVPFLKPVNFTDLFRDVTAGALGPDIR